ncbi:MAG: M67 family metallopeptidase [Candidatus Margulisbacteria bacterium]|nr:M67 family metallopeptidase [Candidatus Margulisiibacteriota bacterium]
MTIQVSQAILDQMIQYSKDELPNESCGYLSGIESVVQDIYPMTNIDASPEHFSFDPKEQFAAMKSAREKQATLVACYHSHPSTPARLSDEDLRLLKDPNMIYIIVSLKDEQPNVKAFQIKDEIITSIEIVVD